MEDSGGPGKFSVYLKGVGLVPVTGVLRSEPLSFPSTIPAPQSSIRHEEMTKECPNASLNGHFSIVHISGQQASAGALQASRPFTVEQSSLALGTLASLV